MRTTLATRRPVTSPCLLCVLRSAAAAEHRAPRLTLQRRLNRRVHSTSNRLAGENLATRPEPENDGPYDIPSQPQFHGFGDVTAVKAAAKWGRKPKPPPPPPEPPVSEAQSTRASRVAPRIEAQAPPTPIITFRTESAPGISHSEPRIQLAQQYPDVEAQLKPSLQTTLSVETHEPETQSLETKAVGAPPIAKLVTSVEAQSSKDTSSQGEINQQAQSGETQSYILSLLDTQSVETEASVDTHISSTQTQTMPNPLPSNLPTSPLKTRPVPPFDAQRPANTSLRSQAVTSQKLPPLAEPKAWGRQPSTHAPAHGRSHAQNGPSWFERELMSPPDTQASTTTFPSGRGKTTAPSRWTPQEPVVPANNSYQMNISEGDEKSARRKFLEGLGETEKQQQPISLSRNQEVKDKWASLQSHAIATKETKAPASGASKGAGRWGVAKKSIFAAAETNSILDQLSGKAPATAQNLPQDPWNNPPLQENFNRGLQQYKTGGDPFMQTSFSTRDQTTYDRESGRFDAIDEALEEARRIEDGVLARPTKKLKKKDRRRGEMEAARAAPASTSMSIDRELSEWERKSSGRERDKLKHNRQWVVDEEEEIEVETKAQMKERKRLEREAKAKERLEQEQQYPPILIPEFVSVSTLARLCKVRLEKFTSKMEDLGFEETNPDYVLNAEMAGLIAMEYGFEPIVDKSHERDLIALPVPEDKSKLPPRPPVVTIMGHVDHGKTTLLDWLRKSSIVDQEHGGITQHIGAFSVNMPSGRVITFLDTPGHEAFLKMRERGANITDIVILVVAADDSIMPQTIEAIKHAKAAGVPIIVAINKCDKEDADPERVKADLARHDIEIEEVGGDTQVVCVSGKTGLGMEDLEDCVLLQADDIDMRAENTGRMEGWIVETTTRTKGRVATVLVRRGTLRKGDVIVAGKTWARVRNLITENGTELEEAPPGTPVEIDGWRDQPDAGDEVLQAESEDKAKSVVEYRLFKEERQQLAKDIEAINEQRKLHTEKKQREARLKELQQQGLDAKDAEAELLPLEQDNKDKVLEVPFIIKADVAGSVEAVAAQVLSVANDELRTKVIRSGVGPLTESDIYMAETTGAYCLTFNVTNEGHILAMAHQSSIKVIEHRVIYAILDDIKELMAAKLKPLIIKNDTGEAEIAQVFQYNVKKRIMKPFAGCRVTRGIVAKGYKARIVRDGETIYEGEIETLKHVKKNVEQMAQGTECGMGFLDFDDFKIGDIVHCYTETKKKRTFY
ncbi:hypothetical protein TWF694_010826 [Orbilia ellipsospora]|uniref:Translation initiation factor IF-2, mitochondrial n=1 Tax=Orbilia ellipsospora TaxID=2528407 RepID=A0AAV9X8B2_9PEZI